MADTTAVFQLGMDLDDRATREIRTGAPRKAQTEAYTTDATTPHAADHGHDSGVDHFITRDGKRYAGTHLIVDLWGAERLDDIAYVERTLVDAVEAAGATLLHIHLHHFTPNGGVSGVAVLAESHISIHSWPECGYAALDVFMCGDAVPERAVDVLREAFRPASVHVGEFLRGEAERQPESVAA
jgi:S-adenosylmethionine decarboxylase